MKFIFCLLGLLFLSSCGIGNVYIIDNSTNENQKITINYAVNNGELNEYYPVPDSLYVTTNPQYSKKTYKWNKNAEYKIPYHKIDEFTYQVELAENEKILIPYRYKFDNSVAKIQIEPNQEIFLSDSLSNENSLPFASKNLKASTAVNYDYKLIGDAFYTITIKE